MYVTRVRVCRRFSVTAGRYAHRRGWQLSPACERVFEKLIDTGVQRMEREKVLEQEEQLRTAEANLTRFIELMAQIDALSQDFPILSDNSLATATRRLCPLWPFC